MRLKTALLACAMTMTMAGAAQARQITSIRLETTITNPTEGWIQIQEITAEANGVNVAAASNGGSAHATSVYSAGYEADKIIDGIEQQGNFYHSGTPQGDIVTAPRPAPEYDPPHRYVQPRRCPRCDGTRVFGEEGWRCCTECGWDELPKRADGQQASILRMG